jgi:chromosome segregation ATPase
MAQSAMQEALAEAEAAAERLASEAESAQAEIEGLVKRVKILDERVEQVGHESQTYLQQLTGDIDKVQHDLDSHGAQLKQNYAELVRKAHDLDHHAQELLQKVHQGTESVNAAHHEVLGNVNQQADEKKNEIHELTDKFDHLHQTAQQHAHEAQTLVNTFKENVDHAVHSFKDNADHFVSELTQVKGSHDEQAHNLVEQITQFVSHAGETMSDMHSNLEP